MTKQVLEYSIKEYRVLKPIQFKLHNDYQIKESITIEDFIEGKYYRVEPDGRVFIHAGCTWDGPTSFPDFKWIMLPSLVHDILHDLIGRGIISVDANDLIDSELEYWISKGKGWNPLYKFRGWYVEKATNTVNQRLGISTKVHRVEYED
jgi:hypothetical protein